MNNSAQIVKPGKHVELSGQVFLFSESKITATVATFNFAKLGELADGWDRFGSHRLA